jgi:hypothetical protein
MGEGLPRLLGGERLRDDVAGGALAGAVVMLVFRFGFDDPWAFSIGAAVLVAAGFVFWGMLGRRRRARKGPR